MRHVVPSVKRTLVSLADDVSAPTQIARTPAVRAIVRARRGDRSVETLLCVSFSIHDTRASGAHKGFAQDGDGCRI